MKKIVILFLLTFTISAFSQSGRVFEEGKKGPYSEVPGLEPRTTSLYLGSGANFFDKSAALNLFFSAKYELRYPFWYKSENFSLRRFGFSIDADYQIHNGYSVVLVFPVIYTYGENLTLFLGPGFLNKEQSISQGDLVEYTRVTLLAIRFGFSYTFRFGNFLVSPTFHEDFWSIKSAYGLSLMFGYTF